MVDMVYFITCELSYETHIHSTSTINNNKNRAEIPIDKVAIYNLYMNTIHTNMHTDNTIPLSHTVGFFALKMLLTRDRCVFGDDGKKAWVVLTCDNRREMRD